MPLTKDQLRRIQDAIQARMLSFSFETLGPAALTMAEVEKLKRMGLIRPSVKNLVTDSYILGKLVKKLEKDRVRDITYDSVLNAARNLPAQTRVEKQAIQYAQEHAGQYIQRLTDEMIRDTASLTARGRMTALRATQEGVAEAVAERETISQLKTRLFHTFEDRNRDWQRVAHTEMNTTIQNAIYNDIREASEKGGAQLVYKRPNPDACEHCRRVYLEDDGITPRVFKLRDLADNNVGIKARNWRATIGSVHPWCNCQLLVLPDGYDFEKRRVIVDPFEGHKRGEIVSEKEFSGMSKEKQSNIGWDAILTHTGKTATPSE